MLKKLEEFLFGKVFGRFVLRLAGGIAVYVASKAALVGISLNPDEVAAALVIGANALYSLTKGWRDKRGAAAAAK